MAKRSRAAPGAAPGAEPLPPAEPPAATECGQARDGGTLSPLDYMLQVLRDPEASPAERKWAAEKAAPYLHPRLQTVKHGGALTLSHEDALEELT